MKYKKGTFVIIPNKEHLKGKPSEMQAIYFWLCDHADENGKCFPTKETLEKEAGCSHNTLDKYLKQLIDDGFISMINRKTKDGRNTSNIYQLLILGYTPPKNGLYVPPKNGVQTIPIINSNQLTSNLVEQVDKPFNSKEYIQNLLNSNQRNLRIVALYFLHTGKQFKSQAEVQVAIKRHIRAASQVAVFTNDDILNVMEKCKQMVDSNGTKVAWTLDTVLKMLTK